VATGVTGVTRGVGGNVGVFISASTPGRVGCDRYRTIKKIMIAEAAISQMRILFLLISSSVILSPFYYNDPITGTFVDLTIAGSHWIL